jgi:ATP-dependent DNA helicase RecQ
LNGHYLDDISAPNTELKFDKNPYGNAGLIVLHLTHKDIWLDFFLSRQNLLLNLKSGDNLAVNNDGCVDKNGNCILKFSNSFKEKLTAFESKGYKLKSAGINYIVSVRKPPLQGIKN